MSGEIIILLMCLSMWIGWAAGYAAGKVGR